MAEQSFPFETQSTSEVQYSYLFRLLADTGVAGASTSSDLRPYGDSTGMFVKVPTGVALVRGFYYLNDSLLTLPVAAAGQAARVDSVVLRLDPAANTVVAVVKAGQAGGAAPALTQTDSGVWEVRLADVQVPAGASTVTAGQVTDRRSYTSLPWGEWTTDGRPTSAVRGKAGFNQTTGRPEYWTGNTWADFSQTTTDAGQLTSGILPDARLPYAAVAGVRGTRPVDAPVDQYGQVNGDWNQVLQPGAYRIFAGNTNQNSAPSGYLYGTLTVYGAGPNVESRTQQYFEHVGGRAYWRTAWNGSDWQPWFTAAGTGDVQAVADRTTSLEGRATVLEGQKTWNSGGALRLAGGTATIASTGFTKNGDTGNWVGTYDVTIPGFNQIVSYQVTPNSVDSGGVTGQVTNPGNGGFRAVVTRRNQAATSFYWTVTGL